MASSVGYNPRDNKIDPPPWFSEKLTEDVKLSATNLCLTKITSARDHTLINNSESGLLTKGIVYLTTEIAFILLVPVALIESAFRFALSWIAYPLSATGVISDDEDDFYARVLKNNPINTAITAFEAFHSIFLGLNPTKEIGKAGFSKELTEQVKLSLTNVCLSTITKIRDNTLINNSESGRIMKGIVYLTSELALVLLVPVALVESAFRSALNWIAYPLSATGIISDDEDDFYARVLINGPLITGLVACKAFHSAFLNLNPTKGIDNQRSAFKTHFPLIGALSEEMLPDND